MAMAILAGYMLPHPPLAVAEIGGGEESKIPATLESFRRVARDIAQLQPETIVIISPHAEAYSDYFQISDGQVAVGSFADFSHPEINFRLLYDTEMVSMISSLAASRGFPAGSEGGENPRLDHGTLVPLYFINQQYSSYKVVRLGLSGLPNYDHYKMGMLIQDISERLNRRVVVIASGDLSHCQKEDGPYGYKKEGPVYDQKIMEIMGKGDFLSLIDFDSSLMHKAEECGHRSFCILAGCFDCYEVKANAMSHEATFGVGYGVVSYNLISRSEQRRFSRTIEDREREKIKLLRQKGDPFIDLAYKSVEEYIRTGKVLKAPKELLSEMKEKKGCFVSLHEFGSLRGCIGTIMPTKANLAAEIIANAIEASTDDPRFAPVNANDLPFLEISVDVLSPLEDVLDRNDLDPKKYGIVVSAGPRRGVLLPDLEGVDTIQDQIDIARRKAGIPKNASLSIERFSVERHK